MYQDRQWCGTRHSLSQIHASLPKLGSFLKQIHHLATEENSTSGLVIASIRRAACSIVSPGVGFFTGWNFAFASRNSLIRPLTSIQICRRFSGSASCSLSLYRFIDSSARSLFHFAASVAQLSGLGTGIAFP